MTLRKIWRRVAERILDGERNEQALVDWVLAEVRATDGIAELLLLQAVTKRVRDMISSAVKPTGETARVPAGQQSFGWLEMEPVLALSKLKRHIRQAYRVMARAAREAQIVGIVDAAIDDGLDPAGCDNFGDLCRAAGVPDDLIEALAA